MGVCTETIDGYGSFWANAASISGINKEKVRERGVQQFIWRNKKVKGEPPSADCLNYYSHPVLLNHDEVVGRCFWLGDAGARALGHLQDGVERRVIVVTHDEVPVRDHLQTNMESVKWTLTFTLTHFCLFGLVFSPCKFQVLWKEWNRRRSLQPHVEHMSTVSHKLLCFITQHAC